MRGYLKVLSQIVEMVTPFFDPVLEMFAPFPYDGSASLGHLDPIIKVIINNDKGVRLTHVSQGSGSIPCKHLSLSYNATSPIPPQVPIGST